MQSKLWQMSQAVFPGGVNSPVRAFGGVGGTPVFMERGDGPFLFSVDGRKYIDLVCGWGPMILGHCNRMVEMAMAEQLKKGVCFGTSTAQEAELACLVFHLLGVKENAAKIRFVSSGTEATMSAVRLARGFTGASKIIKFKGCYHGHGDSFLIEAGSGMLTHGTPSSLGVTKGVAQDTLVATYNDLKSVGKLLAKNESKVACVIVEPVAGNMGVVPPAAGFLQGLRDLCSQHGALLIFDEVMTGFRVARGGAVERYGVIPDILTLGKIIGGGLPLAAYLARNEIMDRVSPLGGVYQAGTLSGNPLAMVSGITTLRVLENRGPWGALEQTAARICEIWRNLAKKHQVPLRVEQVGSMFTPFFETPQVYAKFFHAMLDAGVYMPPSQFEAQFLSTEHSEEVVMELERASEQAFQVLA